MTVPEGQYQLAGGEFYLNYGRGGRTTHGGKVMNCKMKIKVFSYKKWGYETCPQDKLCAGEKGLQLVVGGEALDDRHVTDTNARG